MKYLYDGWIELKERLRGKYLFLFLDYDGTLVPIASSPEKAVLSPHVRELMKALLETSRCRIAVISGRALEEVRQLVELAGVVYAGNHGLEMHGPDVEFTSGLPRSFVETLQSIRAALQERIAGIEGVFVEDKGLGLSMHYRLATPADARLALQAFHEVIQPALLRSEIKTCSGKKVLEVRPPIDWDKGTAVTWILDRWRNETGEVPAVPVYVGDDVTDEDAFAALTSTGVSISVGTPRESRVDYYLTSTEEVRELLLRFVRVLQQETGDETVNKS